ncbi:serine/arginine-rich splicing factor SR45a-like isoform X1 [Lolium rigidum]|uniref:serine/arginine-rich splicing factor SR45a-like isoform X1 n=1 Tax=Lolium rigidum TaxID=89674 RepID=UPI001F5D643C|nr:serine/arginine-rich splicing factor SR45a-like isoform X1 [Lolium rigidum]
MSQCNEVRYTARSITPPAADRDSASPPPKRRALSKSPPLPPPPPFPPKGAVRILSSRSPSRRRNSASRSPLPKRRGRSRSPSPKRRGRSRSPSPKRRGRSRSRSRSRNKSRSRSRDDLRNPGNNLYVTGLSTRTSSSDLEKFFSKEGKVLDCHIVVDPRSKEPRGFAFVTMEKVEDARRCIKHLHRSVLEGRLISVAKAKRTRERTPTPGEYCGPRGGRARSSPRRSSRGSRDRSRSPGGGRDRDRKRD